jgi:radical SAM superfamily enzyme YgiQ (UPF0313 family)
VTNLPQSDAKHFCLILIKPSHYDAAGYVIQWLRAPIPSNSLAVINGLARDCAERKILGDECEIEVHSIDETLERVRVERLARMIEAAGSGMVMLVGVQSNQFPRALDIASQFRERGVQVAIGGFHVSGTLAMLKERDAGIKRGEDMGVSLFSGEAEGRFEVILADAASGRLRPMYDYMDDLPGLEDSVTPILPAELAARSMGNTSFDAGRGCPFSCSFCTIINVQGRKSRFRTGDDVERIIRANVAQGVKSFMITDDNFARNKNWEEIVDRLIQLREIDKFDIKFSIQIDTGTHKIPNFIDKCSRANVRRVFVGLENINPDNLVSARKNQNKITEYRAMLLAWKRTGALIFCGYIIGFPHDTPESIARDIKIIQNELPIDMVEFTCLTPLPGSADHRDMVAAGADLDPDLNHYDLHHVTIDHPKMSRDEWAKAYSETWQRYYTDEHSRTVLRRAVATGTSPGKTMPNFVWFRGHADIEGVHPIEGGFFRLKYRRDRRPEFKTESPVTFYPKYAAETVWKLGRWAALYLRHYRILRSVMKDPTRLEYTDLAITAPIGDEIEDLEMFHTSSGHDYVEKLKQLEKRRAPAAVN